MRKHVAALWLVMVTIGDVLVTPMRHGVPLAAAFVLTACGGGSLSLDAFTSSTTSSAPSVSEVQLAPGYKLVLPQPATYGSRIKVRQLVTLEHSGNSISFEALLSIQPNEVSLVAVDPIGRRALTLNWNGTRFAVEKAPFLPDSLQVEWLMADMIAVYWPAPIVQRSLAVSSAKVEDRSRSRIVSADGTELLKAEYAWTGKSGIVGTMKYTNLSWGYTVSVKSLEVKP